MIYRDANHKILNYHPYIFFFSLPITAFSLKQKKDSRKKYIDGKRNMVD